MRFETGYNKVCEHVNLDPDKGHWSQTAAVVPDKVPEPLKQ